MFHTTNVCAPYLFLRCPRFFHSARHLGRNYSTTSTTHLPDCGHRVALLSHVIAWSSIGVHFYPTVVIHRFVRAHAGHTAVIIAVRTSVQDRSYSHALGVLHSTSACIAVFQGAAPKCGTKYHTSVLIAYII